MSRPEDAGEVALGDLDLWVYDSEVFAHDWLFCFKRVETGERVHFWTEQAEELTRFLTEGRDSQFVSFNGSHYDVYIAKAIAAGCSPEEVHEVNDWIIGGNQGWEHPFLRDFYFPINDVDLMKDTQMGTSLKSIEGHLGMSIEESEVDFTHVEPLTDEERADVLEYCWHDVDATEELLIERHGYLETKLHLGARAGLTPSKSLGLTNAKLTAAVLGARRSEHDDERRYEYPRNLLTEWVPGEVFEFFDRISDPSVPDEDLWSSRLAIDVAGCPVTLGFGGIHGALPTYREEASDERAIVNVDVSSYYPSLMVVNGYTSRNMRSPETFEGIYKERLAAKRGGDKATANALKLVVNTTYGATLNSYNDLYDPLMARSVCISGQLYLLELARHLAAEVPTLRLIQLNTDGVMVSVDCRFMETVRGICAEWTDRTGFDLEEDDIVLVHEKDVNNYALRMRDGSEKVKGGYLVRGSSKAGAYSVNNNAVIVAEALRAHLLDGTPVRETVMGCDDPRKFQLIAKAGGKYSRVFQVVDGAEVPRQKCNRVFACTDASLGRLYKVKRADGQVAKIESLPEHCLVSNAGMPEVGDIDKEWYVALAEKRAADFYTSEEKKMPTKKAAETDCKSMNVYQKLAAARRMFLDAKVSKSGVNDHLEFEYFELDDIIPPEIRIFEEVGLLEHSTKVPGETVRDIDPVTGSVVETVKPALIKAEVVNVDKPEERIEFLLDWPSLPPIKNRDGRVTSNPLQQLGSEQTYVRRYIKQQVLDICEPDETDASLGKAPAPAKSAVDSDVKVERAEKPAAKKAPVKKAVSKAKPAESGERAETAKKLVGADGAATSLQVRQLKNAIRKAKEACGDDPEVAQLIAEIGVKTDNLKGEIAKKDCESYIRALGELKQKHEKAGE